MKTFVVIDGNNLEKHLYNIPLKEPVLAEIYNQCIQSLTRWAKNQNRDITVELCLDPRRVPVQGNDWVEVYIEKPGYKADRKVIEKAMYHCYREEPCIVITNDGDLQDKVQEYQVKFIKVYDFIQSATPQHPNFPPLPNRIPIGVLQAFLEDEDEATLGQSQQPVKGKPRKVKKLQHEIDRIIQRMLEDWVKRQKENEGTFIQLTIKTWPLEKSVNFLKEAFCKDHQRPIREMSGFKTEDIEPLTDILLENCGDEPDFIRRGGCLMDRVRLALLKTEDHRLTLQELGEATGDKRSNIAKKIKGYKSWMQIEELKA